MKPNKGDRTWSSKGHSSLPAPIRGEVLGDWRDTLEKRPVSAGISGSEAAVGLAAGLAAFHVKAVDTIDWSAAPAGATHHIGGNKLEFPWHRVGGPLRYWKGGIWVKRSAFHTLDEAVAKGFAVVALPADLSEPAVTHRLDEATQNVLAAVPALMDEKYSFEPEHKQVSVSNETVPLEQPVAVAGTGISIVEWAAKRLDDIERKAQEAADLSLRVSTLLRENPGLFSANELNDLHQLCDAELTKRDAAVCGGEHGKKFVLVLTDGFFGLVVDNCLTWTSALGSATLMSEKGWEKFKRFGKLAEVRHGKLVMRAGGAA